MSNDLTELQTWAGEILAKLQPAERRQLTRKVGQELRRSKQKSIAAQRNPDGSAYAPRKRKDLRGKKGRIKRRKKAMFTKLRTARHMKLQTDANQISIGFMGRTARIARIHQYGLRDRVGKGGTQHQYERRELLGFSKEDIELISNGLLEHIAN